MPFSHFLASTLSFSYTENKYSIEHPCINNKSELITFICSQTYGQNTVFEHNKVKYIFKIIYEIYKT